MLIERFGTITLVCGDCMEYMQNCPDKSFDLAIVDPPYGINADAKRADTGKNKHIKQKDYHTTGWDKEKPNKKYFDLLFKISKNQIIWGGELFFRLFE